MALSISALEEIGKVNILRTINRIPKSRQKLISIKWDAFYNHLYKSTMGFVNSYPDDLKRNIKSYTLSAINQFIDAPFCEEARQVGLYTDFSKKDKCWISPKLINKELATSYYETAVVSFTKVNSFNKMGLFSTRVLEIEKEVYKDFFKDIPDKITDFEQLEEISKKAPEKAKDFVNRLITEGLVKDSDIRLLLKK